MKTNYLLLLCAIFLMSCNNQPTTEKSVSAITSKKHKKLSPESIFANEQISNLEYQVEAFKIGSEKVVNAELKKYLNENLPELKELLSEYKSTAISNNIEINGIYRPTVFYNINVTFKNGFFVASWNDFNFVDLMIAFVKKSAFEFVFVILKSIASYG